MKYSKPAVLANGVTMNSKCGGGSPCGRPGSKKA